MGKVTSTKLELEDIERILQASLQPVKPRTEFIRQLRSRLAQSSVPSAPRYTVDRNQYLIFGLATLLSGVLIAFTTGRVILAFGAAIGLARLLKNQPDLPQLSTQRVAN